MSHFSEVKTRIRETGMLKKALIKLGYTIEEAPEGVQVRGFFGDTVHGELKISTGTAYDIGFIKGVDGNYEILGDWELMPKVAGIEKEEFLRQLKREYARASILETAKAKGMEVQCTETDGNIELVVTQW